MESGRDGVDDAAVVIVVVVVLVLVLVVNEVVLAKELLALRSEELTIGSAIGIICRFAKVHQYHER